MSQTADTFVKHGRAGLTSLLGEAASLRWLGSAPQGVPVARVLFASEDMLEETRVVPGRPDKDAAERVGRALAHMHAAGGGWWGCPPDGWQGDHLIEGSRTPTVSHGDACRTWGAFFARDRVEAYLGQALDRNVFYEEETRRIRRLAARLREGVYDAPQPALVRERKHVVARLHGDLWAGNLLWDADPANPVGATLIDPMAHGGHAETDLAMLALFGCAHLDTIVAAYDELSPLADGWRERIRLHQVAPLLHHCVLFGRGYVRETMAAVQAYL